MNLRFSRTPIFIRVLLPLIIIAPILLPVNFVLMEPGPVTNLFPKVLTIKGADVASYPVVGDAFLLTVYVSNPDAKVLGYDALRCWASAKCVAMPRSVLYSRHSTTAEEVTSGKKDMKKSQSSAVLAVKALAKKYYPALNLTHLSDNSIVIKLKNTGGPSGGLIFSLGLLDLVTPEDIFQGRKIAATGTISSSGKVGAIGGVEEKIIGAKSAGVSTLFISKENCDQLPTTIKGIDVIAVNTLEEAYRYLVSGKKLTSKHLQGCTNLGA